MEKKSTDDQEQLENDGVKRSFKLKLLRIGFRIELEKITVYEDHYTIEFKSGTSMDVHR